MSSQFSDRSALPQNSGRARPRGLLPLPAEVEEAVAREQARLQGYYTEEYAQRAREDLTLQYYYQDTEVAYRRTAHGVEVVAVGPEEIGTYLQQVPLQQRRDVRIWQP